MGPVETSSGAPRRLIPAHRDPAEYLQYLAQLEEHRAQPDGHDEHATSASRVAGRVWAGRLWKALGLAATATALVGAAILLADLSSRPGGLDAPVSALQGAAPILTPYEPVVTDRNTTTPEQLHVVDRGETLTSIAARYGVSVRAIAALNGLEDTDAILAGQLLTIPAATETAE